MNIFKKFGKVYESLNLVEISQKNLLNNYDFFKKVVGSGQVWPVLKSNAYGHGIKQVVEVLQERDFKYLVVDGYQEVLEIRKYSKRPILMIGAILPSNFSKIKWKNLAIMLQDKESIKELGKLNKKIKVHLKVNTGMNRQGVEIKDLRNIIYEIKKYKKLELEGVFSHLAGTSDDEKQIKKFEEVKKIVGEVKYFHLGATNRVGDIIRLGIGLYGIGKGLKPVLRLKSKIIKIREIEKGEGVSYGGIFVASKKTNIGVIPVGYFEGLDRRLSSKGFVKYKDKFYPIAGRVCMNMVVVDFGKMKPKLWDEVEIISNNPKDKNSIEKIAKICETIPYDILVGIDGSIRRTIV